MLTCWRYVARSSRQMTTPRGAKLQRAKEEITGGEKFQNLPRVQTQNKPNRGIVSYSYPKSSNVIEFLHRHTPPRKVHFTSFLTPTPASPARFPAAAAAAELAGEASLAEEWPAMGPPQQARGGGIDIEACARPIAVDHRIKLPYYFRIAGNLLRQVRPAPVVNPSRDARSLLLVDESACRLW